MYIYSNPDDVNDPYKLPNVEVFHSSKQQELEDGYYYWYCFPGCMPEGGAFGPFPTLEAAITAAQEE